MINVGGKNVNKHIEILEKNEISVLKYGAKGDGVTDDTAAIQAAVNAINNGVLYFPPGEYLITSTVYINKSNVTLKGERGSWIINKSNIYVFRFVSPYTTPADALKNISILNLNFNGYVELSTTITDVNSHFGHQVALHGCKNVRIEGCQFIGFRSDGVCLSVEDAGQVPDGVEHRRNENIIIRDCLFDGVNQNNRNAISIISGVNVKITGNTIKNCTHSTMPGGIDIEPNPYPVYKIQDIEIANNTFDNIGGTNGAVSVYAPVGATLQAIKNISVHNNTFRNVVRYLFVRDDARLIENVAFNHNHGRECSTQGSQIEKDLKNLTMIGNDLEAYGLFWFNPNGKTTNGVISKNRFRKLYSATLGNIAVQFEDSKNLKIVNNHFIASPASMMINLANVGVSKMLFIDNQLEDEVGTSEATCKYVSSTVTDAETICGRNYGINPNYSCRMPSASFDYANLFWTGDKYSSSAPLTDYPFGESWSLGYNWTINTVTKLYIVNTFRYKIASAAGVGGGNYQTAREYNNSTRYIRFWDQTNTVWGAWTAN